MTDFRTVRGFEEVWRPVAGQRVFAPGAHPSNAPMVDTAARLSRVARRAPEVVVKVTGRVRDPGHLRAHLDYISRNGALTMEDRDGALLETRAAIRELADDWTDLASSDPRRTARTPLSLALVLSMPAGADAVIVRDAARAFARETFADRFDYVFALHTDAGHPHVHIDVRALGDHGERLNPKKADLEQWRQTFAQALRDRGVEAEATPRRARGVTRKAERLPLRKMADRKVIPNTRRAAWREAAKAAFHDQPDRKPWEDRMLARQARIRALYLAQARILARSPHASDKRLARDVAAFVKSMPQPDSRRLALARQLRAAGREAEPETGPARERPRRR